MEKVATILVSAHCEAQGISHLGQYGCRAQQSAVGAIAVWPEIVLSQGRTEFMIIETTTDWSGMACMQPLMVLKGCRLRSKLRMAS